MTIVRGWVGLLFVGSISCAVGVTDPADGLGVSPLDGDDGASDGGTGRAPTGGGATGGETTPSVNVTLAGSGSGSVASDPAGLACPGDCAEVFAAGTAVTLTATAAADSELAGWSGGGCTGVAPCVVRASGRVDVVARFDKKPLALTVTKSGDGAGTVTSAKAGIDCGATCSASFDAGSQVTLAAAPAAGSTFAGWSGGCTGTTATCQVTMATPMTVTASFTQDPHVLSVTKGGTGSGTVTSNPVGIACGATCSASFAHGTSVTLTASAAGGSTFAGWAGSGCAGTGPCTVAMSAARAVTATFNTSNLTCATANNAAACSNAVIAEINLGSISASSCRAQCETRLEQAAVPTGCWIVALNNICYCRGGAVSGGGSRPGGSCN
jgi:uncharacterized repeat protein (TIGR02543 family)